MADLSDVERALVDLIAAALVKPGSAPYLPGAIAETTTGQAVRVFRGWPLADQFNRDLAAGIATVSVFSRAGMTRRMTCYPRNPAVLAPATNTLTAAVAGNVVTFGGQAAAGQLAGVLVNGAVHTYPVKATDTLSIIAASLAALVGGASSSGAMLTLPTEAPITARTGAFQDAVTEIRRQSQGFLVTCFCPDPTSRDSVAAAVDLALAETDWIALPYGTAGRLLYANTTVDDFGQKNHEWKRAFVVSVEYPTVSVQSAPPMLFGDLTIDAGNAPPVTVIV